MNKVLIAIDGSENSLRAAEFVGKHMASLEGLQITLLHVLAYVPAPLWDDGHILSGEEKEARSRVIEKWLDNQRSLFEPAMREAAARLSSLGVPAARIEVKTISDSTDAADSIIEEAKNGFYRIVVLGRCGHAKVRHFPVGSVASRVINRGAGLHLCLVD